MDVVVSSLPDPSDARPWSSGLASPGRSGAIIFASSLNPLDQHILDPAHVPYVLIDPDAKLPEPSVATVVGRRGALGGAHLLRLGRRRLAVIYRSVAMLCSRARIDGTTAYWSPRASRLTRLWSLTAGGLEKPAREAGQDAACLTGSNPRSDCGYATMF
jgi:DNA-binding LacI/PurR family transcriptional regulator